MGMLSTRAHVEAARLRNINLHLHLVVEKIVPDAVFLQVGLEHLQQVPTGGMTGCA